MSGEESDDNAEIISSGGAKSSSDEESDNPSEYDNASNAEGDASHWFFRKRFNQNHLLFEWKDPESAGDDRVIFMYQEDLDSLLPDGLLTGTVLDYFIYRYMAGVQGLVCACGSGMYLAMETARYTRKSTRKTRLLEELIAQRDWTSYKYLILPVSGRNHWSFLVLENVMNSEPTKVYHVNSLKNAHSPDYAFDVVNWFLSRLHEKKMLPPFQWSTFIHNMKPQQSNTLDCGVYALYYMDFISKKISVEKPDSVQQNMALWATGGLNVTKAGVYRSQLYNRISLGP
ncbi:hypothetical protein PF007_g30458 [Phytophthora fragariae]|uniref:Ubiquitin-like protease family profile domain-containing protein n=1 Tax=Phytophthora fragariae TaxID=53985 RepID=A0A6A3PVZ8_9STRA|nr:hypothetical protein PF007_g30458 [Phytophthora fragariae]